jgi:hypothetical protein
VVRRNIPASDALAVWQRETARALQGEYGAGAVVYLQPAGEHDRLARLAGFLAAAATDDDVQLGRIVRDVWMAWAREQPDVAQRPDWLDPWEQLPARIQDVDTRIGRTLFALGCAAAIDRGDDDPGLRVAPL